MVHLQGEMPFPEIRASSVDHTHVTGSFSVMEYFLSQSVRDLDVNATVFSDSQLNEHCIYSIIAGVCNDLSGKSRVKLCQCQT